MKECDYASKNEWGPTTDCNHPKGDGFCDPETCPLNNEALTPLRAFAKKMEEQFLANLEEKGDSWKRCNANYLVDRLMEHINRGNWVAVANFAWMLDTKEVRK